MVTVCFVRFFFRDSCHQNLPCGLLRDSLVSLPSLRSLLSFTWIPLGCFSSAQIPSFFCSGLSCNLQYQIRSLNSFACLLFTYTRTALVWCYRILCFHLYNYNFILFLWLSVELWFFLYISAIFHFFCYLYIFFILFVLMHSEKSLVFCFQLLIALKYVLPDIADLFCAFFVLLSFSIYCLLSLLPLLQSFNPFTSFFALLSLISSTVFSQPCLVLLSSLLFYSSTEFCSSLIYLLIYFPCFF